MGNVTAEWPLRTIGDLVMLQRGIDLPDHSRAIGNVPIMGSFGITGRHDVAACSGPGVTVGRSGASAGTVCYINIDYWPLNTCLYVRDFKGNDPRFAYYYLKTVDLAGMNSGSAQPSLNRNFVHPMPARFPEPPEQSAIAALLSALDDKIELNQQMNETLEASARALFQDWFVDFGPTRAKAEGRPAYLAPDLWSLFPDRLSDNGMPEGWAMGKLGDIAMAVNAKVEPEHIDPITPYIGLEHMPRRSISLSEWEGAGKVTSGKSTFKQGQVLFGKLRPYFHKVGVAPIDGICSTDIVVMQARQFHYAACLLAMVSTDEFVAFTDQGSTGTKMPRTSWALMSKYPLAKALPSVTEAFQRLVGPMVERVIGNIRESRKLAATRDTLLPKLMSGELRICDAAALAA